MIIQTSTEIAVFCAAVVDGKEGRPCPAAGHIGRLREAAFTGWSEGRIIARETTLRMSRLRLAAMCTDAFALHLEAESAAA